MGYKISTINSALSVTVTIVTKTCYDEDELSLDKFTNTKHPLNNKTYHAHKHKNVLY